MGLIKCIGCGEMVSEDEILCPKCYYSIYTCKDIYDNRAVSSKLKEELIRRGTKIIMSIPNDEIMVEGDSIVYLQRLEKPYWDPTIVKMQNSEWVVSELEGLRIYDVYKRWENETYQIIDIKRDPHNYDPYNGWEDLAPGLNNSAKWNGNDFYPARGRKGKL